MQFQICFRKNAIFFGGVWTMKGGKYGNGTAGKGKEGWPPEVLCDGAVEEHGGVTHDNCTGVVVDGECRVVESRNKVLSRKDRTEFARKWWWTVNARVVVGEQSSVAKSGFETKLEKLQSPRRVSKWLQSS
jgi:hypothetical protein